MTRFVAYLAVVTTTVLIAAFCLVVHRHHKTAATGVAGPSPVVVVARPVEHPSVGRLSHRRSGPRPSHVCGGSETSPGRLPSHEATSLVTHCLRRLHRIPLIWRQRLARLRSEGGAAMTTAVTWVATCETTGKRSYTSRAAAKAALTRTQALDHMRPYTCPDCGYWHVGHLPKAVMRGKRTAAEHYNPQGAEMVTHVETLNATRSEIEEALLAGKAPAEIVRDLSEPMPNVLTIYRDLRNEGRLKAQNFDGAPKPAASTPNPNRATAADLFAHASTIDDKRIQTTLERARKAVADLTRLVGAWEAKSAARLRVERLEAELAAARAELRGKPAASGKVREARNTGGAGPRDNATIREWAKANGHNVGSAGRIPASIVAAYDAATGAAEVA